MNDNQVAQLIAAIKSVASALGWIGFTIMMAGTFDFCGRVLVSH